MVVGCYRRARGAFRPEQTLFERLGMAHRSPGYDLERSSMPSPRLDAPFGNEHVCQGTEADSEPLEQPSRPCPVLLYEPDPTLGKRRQEGWTGSGRPSGVNDRCRRLEDDVEARFLDPLTQIDVLAIQKKALVPTPDAFEQRAPDQEACSRNPLNDCPFSVLVGISNDFVTPFAPRKDSLEKECLRVSRD